MGLFALGGFADRVGLTEALSAAVPRRGERAPVHDRGRVLVHALLMLAAVPVNLGETSLLLI